MQTLDLQRVVHCKSGNSEYTHQAYHKYCFHFQYCGPIPSQQIVHNCFFSMPYKKSTLKLKKKEKVKGLTLREKAKPLFTPALPHCLLDGVIHCV